MPVDVPCTGARSADFPLVLKAWSLTETHVPPRRSQRTGPRGVLGEAPTESRDATRTPPIRFPSGRAQRRPRVERLARCTPCGSPRARWGASAPVGAPAPHSLVSLILLPEDLYDVIRVERRVQGPRGSSAWKIGSSGDGADEDAAALDDLNDGQESCRQPADPYARWRIPATALAAPSNPIYPLRSSRPRTGRRPQARPVSRRTVCEVTTVWLGGATGRAATRDSGQNGSGAVRSAVAVIRH